ncbi:class I SAM-dependent rRNA methyltransferase [Desulfomicrobium escambiense]|uniref:class I SAM-dependent rRNA methyltransferase n=1 Tax=Desulfomicrobium escambiense TaxID=29503 RepID=UPI00041B9097|nr:class I SAM-dependent methyltransferase [Desulfomicrobium escambiense]
MPRGLGLRRILRLLGAKKGQKIGHASRERVRFATAERGAGFFPRPGSPAVPGAAPAGNSGELQGQQSWSGHAPPGHEPQPDRAENRDVHQQGAEDGQQEMPSCNAAPKIVRSSGAIFPVDAPRGLTYVFGGLPVHGAQALTLRGFPLRIKDIIVDQQLIIAAGREKSLFRRHPWIFSGAVASVKGRPKSGQTVDVLGQNSQWLARAAFSPKSQIQGRVWTFDADERIDAEFFLRRIGQSAARRRRLETESDALRLVQSESDGLPGLILDRYAAVLVFQLLTAGAEFWRAEIIAALRTLFPDDAILERSDVDVRAKEGLAERIEAVHGEIPELVEIRENGVRLLVDVRSGHKTGFYLDQRDSRLAVGRAAAGAEVLNCFSYTGGFGLAALRGGAKSVTQLDASAPALELAVRNRALNGFAPDSMTTVCGDAFQILRAWRKEGRTFDLIVLDPPKFVDSKASLTRAARGYKDVNLCAFHLLRPGGRLFTFSCSGLMEDTLFQKIVADAALDAGRTGRIVRRLTQAPDHPVELAFPEGAYLKGLEIEVE